MDIALKLLPYRVKVSRQELPYEIFKHSEVFSTSTENTKRKEQRCRILNKTEIKGFWEKAHKKLQNEGLRYWTSEDGTAPHPFLPSAAPPASVHR